MVKLTAALLLTAFELVTSTELVLELEEATKAGKLRPAANNLQNYRKKLFFY